MPSPRSRTKSRVSASAFIRAQPATMSAAEVITKGKAQGLTFSPQLVSAVRSQRVTGRSVGRRVDRSGKVALARSRGPRLLPQPRLPADLYIRKVGRGGHMILVSFSLGRLRDLTHAELAVARMAAGGDSNAVIARVRGTSRHTVARQMTSVLRKLHIGARLSLATISELGAWSPSRPRRHVGLPGGSLPSGEGHGVEPTEAAHIWREIALGQWATLAGVDVGGLRRALMKHDSVKPVDWLALSKVHRQALALAAGGFSQRVIALKLGLPASTVSGVLASARKRLGFRSLGHLLRAYCAPEPTRLRTPRRS
jgi:DNA-binding CsgD family transcriptional regulator